MFSSLKLYLNQNIELKELVKTLVEYNYQSCAQVNQEADFSRRGGIIDIFPVSFENPVRLELVASRINSIRSFDLISARTLTNHQAVIILPAFAFKGGRLKRNYLGVGCEVPVANFVDLEPGDYVVHVNYGIGKFLGMKKLRQDKGFVDHMIIEYDLGDKLYVPAQELHLVNKYVAFVGLKARLSRLGTKTWASLKKRTKQGIYSLANDLLRIQAARSALAGFSFSADNDWQRQLEQSFAYQDTPDQLKTAREVKQDMQQSHPMDRLICGEVGYGKTEVALRAAFKAVMDNKQVAMLVPTTILAEQHHYTFAQRLKDFPVNVQMLSRFRSAAEQQKVIAGIQQGRVDIVIGTHRLLSADVQFKDLGLVIVDEEQRFGVKHKERLKQLRLLVDVLTLTATPIPRTLYLSLMGARDMSVINTPPLGRVPIQTKVCEYDGKLIRKSILRELNRRGQCYFIHNRVKDIEKVKKDIAQLVPEARIESAHGQMPERQLEEIMLRFIQGKIDVLVATTIVESGIDIPNANTLFVNRADRFGLADLYQLRGRVGRFKYKAYAFFLVPRGQVWTKDAQRRLSAIEKHSALGSGFKIAMEDLQIRGAGNLLGQQQHGWIAAVGFDLYCRLLRETINEAEKKDSADFNSVNN
ncbi:transcription-repair coupling factor [Candidatus Omnitrophota bacterium]